MSRAQIRIIERRAIRRYKQEIKSKIQCCLCATTFVATMVLGVVYNFIVF